MDALDVKILRTMGVMPFGRKPRPPSVFRPSVLAKQVGATKDRVRDRIAKMQQRKIIRGYQITPNHRHLGLESTCFLYRFPDEDAVDRAMKTLTVAEGVMGCYAFLGGSLCVQIVYASPSALERRMKVLLALAGEGEIHKFYDLDMPVVNRPLSGLDWRIIQELRGDALRPLSDVAKALRVNLKTVRRHFDRMGKEGSFFITPQFDPTKAEGALLFYLMLHLDSDAGAASTPAIHRAFQANLLSIDSPTDLQLGHVNLMLFAASLAQVDALRKTALGIKGVERAVPYLFRSVIGRGNWEDEIIAERMQASARPPVTEAMPVAR